ncbi:adhesion G-protein coupled receptor F1-like [Limanda limanda]|uniref:adhesion G-protein coupled receptor F1-like n=1 Tax=Limanda limanda TaxID=27771 RepID=UPI0029C85EB0|nr:adhesion G-protein coupled receptor F1-like [Limanda limanda]
MFSRLSLILIGAAYIYYQVNALEVYIAELEVENNITMETQTILSLLNISVEVNGSSVMISEIELVSECFLIGDTTSCNCSVGYSWSNEVCYNSSCCTETTCTQNMSHIEPLCVAKVQGLVNITAPEDSVRYKSSPTLNCTFEGEAHSTGWKLIRENKHLDLTVGSVVTLKDCGSSCIAITLKEVTSSGSGTYECGFTFGSVTHTAKAELKVSLLPEVITMKIDPPVTDCSVSGNKDVTVTATIKNSTESYNVSWQPPGGESRGPDPAHGDILVYSVKHVPAASHSAPLPRTHPRCLALCPAASRSPPLPRTLPRCLALCPAASHSAPLPRTLPRCLALCPAASHSAPHSPPLPRTLPRFLALCPALTPPALHSASHSAPHSPPLPHAAPADRHTASPAEVREERERWRCSSRPGSRPEFGSGTASHDPFVSSEKICPKEGIWPKTPKGGRVINQCDDGKTGYKSRTCGDDGEWQMEFSSCISEELNKVINLAEVFKTGIGATQEAALGIFQALKTTTSSNSSNDTAGISASISIMKVMATGSESITLKEEVLNDFLKAASNLLANDWTGVNKSVTNDMSSQYIIGVESLVKNIQVNNTLNISNPNLDFKVSKGDCNISVFNVTVKLNETGGQFKTVGVRNLMDKLDNSFKPKSTSQPDFILIVTKNGSSSTEITMDFPIKQQNDTELYCVFWDTINGSWSDTGCRLDKNHSDSNHTLCKCNHLTPFSVLVSKYDTTKVKDKSYSILDTITYVGLAVSICSLVILLIIEALVWSVVVKTDLSYFRHTALVNIAVFLLLADCSFLASMSPENLSADWCLILTICKHLFYLAMFSWMLCMSVMLIHRLIFVFSPLRKQVFMFLSSIVGYGCPVLIVGFSYVYCKYNEKDYYNKDTCWLIFDGPLEGSLFAFLLPVGTVIFTNLFSMAVVIFTLLKSSAPDGNKLDEKETFKSIIKVVVFLTPVFGVTWGIGFFLQMFDKDDEAYLFLEYSFNILNSFQGFFVMLTGVFAEPKVRQELLKRMDKGKYDTMKNLTSASNTKER